MTDEYRSVSQINSYQSCPQRYYLERRAKVWQRPAAWSPQGTALHSAAEAYELSRHQGSPASLEDMEAVFSKVYSEKLSKLCEITPNLLYWFSSGPYKGAEDIPRRYGLGIEQVKRYHHHRNTGEGVFDTVVTDEKNIPFVEREFDFYLGNVRVKGFIDNVSIRASTTQMTVIDIKSGKDPGDAKQLAVYRDAVASQLGVTPTAGTYWMGRTGKHVERDLNEFPTQRLVDEFGEVDRLIKAEVFDPDPDDKKCMFCSVIDSCPIYKGRP